jgi:hypothetical protein
MFDARGGCKSPSWRHQRVLAALLVEQRTSNWRSIEERERFWAEEAKLVAWWFFIAAAFAVPPSL